MCGLHVQESSLRWTRHLRPQLSSQEWDRLIPQSVLTLNLIRSSRTNPSLSSHAAINGNFDFNATPLAPPGTKVLVHEAASNRPSFSTHAVDNWYIGPLPQPLPLLPLLHPHQCIHQARRHVRVLPKALQLPQGYQIHLPSPSSRGYHSHLIRQTSHIFAPFTLFWVSHT